jgi:UDPglucose 6-dehydrogenase
MRISMIGAGYVGLVSGACLADFGHEVICVDNDEEKVALLNRGETPIYEPQLGQVIAANVAEERLRFTTDLRTSAANADAVFIAVGTPSRRGDGHADLSYVYAAAREVAGALTEHAVVVTKSTVPVGTGDEVERIIRSERRNIQPPVVSNPEFLREGAAVYDFKHPDRIVIGLNDERAREVMSEIYRPLHLNASPIMYTDRRSAELIKYASNAFLATKITFINEIADLSERIGANVQDVARGMGLDKRIGPKFLHPGPGFGGSCFPKDAVALAKTARDHEAPLRIVETVVDVNDHRKRAMAKKVAAALGGNLRDRTIAVLGLTFKPNTDDIREAPSIPLITALQDFGARVRACDAAGTDRARQVLENVEFCANAYDCATDAHAVVIVTEWDQFRALDLKRLAAIMACPVIVDLRNIYAPDEVIRHGFFYSGVGTPLSLSY